MGRILSSRARLATLGTVISVECMNVAEGCSEGQLNPRNAPGGTYVCISMKATLGLQLRDTSRGARVSHDKHGRVRRNGVGKEEAKFCLTENGSR